MAESERRLAAIMFTDIVGYTALTQSNEAAALKLLEKHRSLIRPVFARFGGHEVKTIGDAFLVEFGSALQAAESAVEIQKVLHGHNEESVDKVLVRVGIHVGDVVHSGGDVYGDAVNIASRIVPQAQGGEVCISGQVYDQVKNKLSCPIVKLDSRQLKNVKDSIDVFRIVMPWEGEQKTAEYDRRRIAVLPFANFSPDPNDGFFADGITEEIITTVSNISELTVISRTSVMGYKGSTKKLKEIGRELEVGSVLEGSVRKAGNRIRITTQLIEVADDKHVWAQSYDRNLDDVFAVQSDIARNVCEALKVKLLSSEVERISKKETDSTAAHIRYLKGRSALSDRTEKTLVEAKRFFEEASAEDHDYARAYVGLADVCFLLGEYAYMPMREAMGKVNETLTKALSLDEDLPEALTAHANLLQHEYRFA
jgi:adenylate cyclase